MQKKQFLKFPISVGSYSSFVDHIISLAYKKESAYVCIANVHMLIESYGNKQFANVITNADVITPDGMPLVWGLSLIHGIKQERVAGMDLLPDLLQNIMSENLSAYFYGGTQELLDKTVLVLKDKFPQLKIAGTYSPPFRDLSPVENEQIINNINLSQANIVFVVLGCPKQEKWMASMKGKINCCMVGIGGALPVIMGLHSRAPVWMQKGGLEWLFRLSLEPRRLFKRYAYTNSLFLWLFFKEYLRVKVWGRLGLSKPSP